MEGPVPHEKARDFMVGVCTRAGGWSSWSKGVDQVSVGLALRLHAPRISVALCPADMHTATSFHVQRPILRHSRAAA